MRRSARRTQTRRSDVDASDLPTVDAAEALRLVGDGALLLDVREPAEWDAGHAPEAEHVPLGALTTSGYAPAAGSRVLVICRSGNRSKSATAHLIALGVDAWNVAGGMAAWQASGGPVVDLEGAPGRVA